MIENGKSGDKTNNLENILQNSETKLLSSHKKAEKKFYMKQGEESIISEDDQNSSVSYGNLNLQLRFSENSSGGGALPARRLFSRASGDGNGEQTDCKFNLMGNAEMSADTSPVLGNHLFLMESGEGLRSKPTTDEHSMQFTDESNMEEDVTDSDPSGLPAQHHHEPVTVTVNFSHLAFSLGAALAPPAQNAATNNQVLACQLENTSSEMTDEIPTPKSHPEMGCTTPDIYPEPLYHSAYPSGNAYHQSEIKQPQSFIMLQNQSPLVALNKNSGRVRVDSFGH